MKCDVEDVHVRARTQHTCIFMNVERGENRIKLVAIYHMILICISVTYQQFYLLLYYIYYSTKLYYGSCYH